MVTLHFQDGFRVDNVFEKENIVNKNLTAIFPNKNILDMMDRHKSSYVYMSIYDTNIEFEDESFIEMMNGLNTGANATIMFAPFPEVFFNNPHLESFNGSLKIGNKYQRVHGRYVIILLFFHSVEQAKEEIPAISKRIANSLRLSYGIGAVGECAYEGYYGKLEDGVTINSIFKADLLEKRTALDVSSFYKFSQINDMKIREFLLNGEAEILFNRASIEKEIGVRFLFLWLCLDSMINGKQRRSLFSCQLKSEMANEEVSRLKSIRDQIAHGKNYLVKSEDCTSALWAIRISVCPDKETQKQICFEYEKWITQRLLT